jgi:hypothetical protein
MSNESLAAPSAPLVGARGPGVVSIRAARSWVAFGPSSLVGAGACVAAVLVCVGASAPWFSFSLFSITAKISGLNSRLDGRYAVALGVVGFVLGAMVAVLRRGAVRRAVLAALALVGALGIAMVWHQYVHLSHNATTIGRTSGLAPFAKYFDVHAGAGWGIWLDGISFGAFVVAAALASIVQPRR